jgi:hypothetical protein
LNWILSYVVTFACEPLGRTNLRLVLFQIGNKTLLGVTKILCRDQLVDIEHGKLAVLLPHSRLEVIFNANVYYIDILHVVRPLWHRLLALVLLIMHQRELRLNNTDALSPLILLISMSLTIFRCAGFDTTASHSFVASQISTVDPYTNCSS